MRATNIYPGLIFLLCLIPGIGLAAPVIHHELKVTLYPAGGKLEVQDSITLPSATDNIEFTLHHNLQPSSDSSNQIKHLGKTHAGAPVPLNRFRISFPSPVSSFSLNYQGEIRHSLEQISRDYSGDMQQTPGLISEDGVFLSLSSHWFPTFGQERFTFKLQTSLPPGWSSVSQGEEIKGGGWKEPAPQDDIYLIAAPYQIYRQGGDTAEAMVFLREPDPETAQHYLEATHKYLDLYSRLLGDYPYRKFALVENFWETGYGMPSFTLLGPTVIRLPFIIYTSYPHEILHNWWGNGVYVDYAKGNWSEGLTSYLADHLLKEQRGQGEDYRRTSLQRYADFIAEQEDFALVDFRSRHSQATQAIGYGKTMMLFHMLRRQLGDKIFLEGLRHFYKGNLFNVAGFDDLEGAFKEVSGHDLSAEFNQWTRRTGAPSIGIEQAETKQKESGYQLQLKLKQTQAGHPFHLDIPILIQLEGQAAPMAYNFEMDSTEAQLSLDLPARPIRLQVDPQFDLFRRLDPSEIPSSLGQLFSDEAGIIVLPSKASAPVKEAFQALAEGWARRGSNLEIKWDNQLQTLPSERAVWLFGSNNLHAPRPGDTPYNLDGNNLSIQGSTFTWDQHSLVLTYKNPANQEHTIGWLSAHSVAAIPLLGRKLPHYMKYSYLVFEGDRATNRLKGQWPLDDSVLNLTLSDTKGQPEIKLPQRAPLSALVD